MNQDELNFLEAEYLKDSDWDTEKTRQLAFKIGLNRIKIYKWHYDRKKQDKEQEHLNNISRDLLRDE